ncbi:MAG: hypothetical protein ABIR18_03955 [Chitinophagaceae bacterium]
MKPILFTLLCLSGIQASSQNCNYYYLQDGKTAEITFYTKKGDESGKGVYAMSSVNKTGSVTTGIVKSDVYNKKGKVVGTGTNNIKCDNGILMVDLKAFISPEQSEQIKADAKASNVYLAYPASMKAGDALPDGKMNIDIEQNNGMKTNVDVKITDRKVEAQESVTTPAGTWNCYKITYHSAIKIAVMGIGIPIKADVTEWFAPNFGVVKTESSKGATTVLTKFQ